MATSNAQRAFNNEVKDNATARALEAMNDTFTPTTLTVSGNATVGGTLGVTGNTTLSGTLAVTGASTLTGVVTAAAGVLSTPETLTAAADSGAGSSIDVGKTAVNVTGVTTDANDWIVLPAIASVPFGHQIVICCNAGANFEIRTPASSGTTINNVDSDGTQEYLATNTDTIVMTKALATGWIGVSYTALGAVRAAVVPD